MSSSMNLFFFVALMLLVTTIFSPAMIGEWQAARDIAYDAHYVANCACVDEYKN